MGGPSLMSSSSISRRRSAREVEMGLPFAWRLRHQRRRTLAVHVLDDASVEARVPHGWSRAAVGPWLRGRSEWGQPGRRRALRRARRAYGVRGGAGGGAAPLGGGMLAR